MLGTRGRKRNRGDWKIELLMSLHILIPGIMGVGLFGAMFFPKPLATICIYMFLLPFVLIAGMLVFGALAGILGRLFR